MDELYSMWSEPAVGDTIDYIQMVKFIENMSISDIFLTELETTLRLISHKKIAVKQIFVNGAIDYKIEIMGSTRP